MFRVLGMYNFGLGVELKLLRLIIINIISSKCTKIVFGFGVQIHAGVLGHYLGYYLVLLFFQLCTILDAKHEKIIENNHFYLGLHPIVAVA